MSVQSLNSPRNTHLEHDERRYPDAFAERDRIFVLVAVDERPAKRIEPRTVTPVRMFSRIAGDTILLASIVALGVFAVWVVAFGGRA